MPNRIQGKYKTTSLAAQIDKISNIFCDDGFRLNRKARTYVGNLIRKYGYEEVFKSALIAYYKYIGIQENDIAYALDKVGGICYNRSLCIACCEVVEVSDA